MRAHALTTLSLVAGWILDEFDAVLGLKILARLRQGQIRTTGRGAVGTAQGRGTRKEEVVKGANWYAERFFYQMDEAVRQRLHSVMVPLTRVSDLPSSSLNSKSKH